VDLLVVDVICQERPKVFTWAHPCDDAIVSSRSEASRRVSIVAIVLSQFRGLPLGQSPP